MKKRKNKVVYMSPICVYRSSYREGIEPRKGNLISVSFFFQLWWKMTRDLYDFLRHCFDSPLNMRKRGKR